ncbi:Hypothetical protein [Arabidopsis thaliana]|uniref:F1O19.7 protein n=1 Tax=Arabidopsis thaliana TaxID=3702 RepID=Q9FZH9_ARATH|nr:uncharacterized protein AT1G67020 [Arabidopsis thaliana]AAF98211.1 Hypothetical protein [Arabidopsis thaliana]AEE34583.1 transmembrane protein [Arabidopsis thaliana]|eukprot:NP_176872.1 transmembrane protein [Arabidopsis thaliana]
MALGDESEVFESENCHGDETERNMKVLFGGFKRLCADKVQHEEKLESMDSVLRQVVATLERMEIREGKRVEQGEHSCQSPRHSFSSSMPQRGAGESPILLDNRSSLIRRIEMPVFDGSGVYEWFSKVERFFRVGRYQDSDKLDLVALSLEGVALKWFLREMSTLEFRDWNSFEQRLLARFDPVKIHSSPEVLMPTTLIHVVAHETESRCTEELIEEDESSVRKKSNPEIVLITQKKSFPRFQNVATIVVGEFQEGTWFFDDKSKDNEANNSSDSKLKFGAYKVLDKILIRSHNLKQRRKLSLSPKNWMFKFKNRNLQQNRSKMDPCQAIEFSNIHYMYLCFSANVGLVRKNKSFQSLRLKKQAHMSRDLKKLESISSEELQPALPIVETLGDEDMVALQSDLRRLGEANFATIDSAQLLRLDDATLMNSALKRKCSKSWHFIYKHYKVRMQNLHTGIYKTQRPWHCLVHEANNTDSHLWHRWKTKVETLQEISEFLSWGLVHSHSSEVISFLGFSHGPLVTVNGASSDKVIDAAATSIFSEAIGLQQYEKVMILCMRLFTCMTLTGMMIVLFSSGCAICVFESCHRLTHKLKKDQSMSLHNIKKRKFLKAWKFKYKQKVDKRDMAAYQNSEATQIIQKLVVSFFLLLSLRTSLSKWGEY